jgi:hypothetical protein
MERRDGGSGTDFASDGLLRERILAMRAIWTKDPAEFRGEFVNFPPMLGVSQTRARADHPASGSRPSDASSGWPTAMDGCRSSAHDTLAKGETVTRGGEPPAGAESHTVGLYVPPREEEAKSWSDRISRTYFRLAADAD